MPPQVLFTADSHWSHQATLGTRLGLNRRFETIEEHDEALIARWNAAVRPQDTVWHLGDFCYRCPEDRARAIFARLNGRQRFLVRGNHDRVGARLPWDGVFDVTRVLVPLPDGTVQGVLVLALGVPGVAAAEPWRHPPLRAFPRPAARHGGEHGRWGGLLRLPA